MAHQLGPQSEFTSSARNHFFTKLKPVCVDISRLVLQGQQQNPDKAASDRRLQDLVTQLNGTLEAQIQYDATVLDHKLADYVFFPLSHVLRQQGSYSIRLIETVIKSLRLLIQYGWKARISKDLSQQLLILLTFIVGGVPGQERSQPTRPEETILEGYKALTVLIRFAGLSSKDSPLTDSKIIPSFGHAVSVILDSVVDGATPAIQLEALQAILTVYNTIKQDDVLATFFPGTVSSLCRVLSPPISTRAQRRVLVSGVNVLRAVLTNVLGDLKTRNLLRQTEEAHIDADGAASKNENTEGKVLTPAWLKATVAQVKVALSTVLKLRNHDGADVRMVMERLCITLLDECHSALSNCTSMLVESAMVLREDHNGPASLGSDMLSGEKAMFFGTSLQDLATIYPELTDAINTTVYNWITTMPRAMQSSDERVKQQALRNIVKSSELVSALQIESSNLEELLSSALRDSVVTLVLNTKDAKVLNEVEFDQNLWRSSDLVQTSQELQTYRPVILAQESQRDTRKDVASLIHNIGSSTQQTRLAADMLPYIRDSTGVNQISSFWLSFELVKSSFAKTSEVDDLLDLTNAAPDPSFPEDQESVFNELYSFSVSMLDAHSDANDEVDWRLEAIALEITAFGASRLGQAFRPELIDVLYPIATFLGATRPELRGHAITTLNSIAMSCGYGSVSELIIDNVDYMVNSISLRLNQFDISPASTKVLTMMIRLTGPSLLPYLDDVVAGIFAALDNYHGYSAFVGNLFGVLSEVVEQGVKADNLLIQDGKSKPVSHKKRPLESSGIEDTLALLDKRVKRKREEEEEDDVEEIIRGHPAEAWKSAKEELDAIESRDKGEDEPEEEPASNDEVAPPKSPTYTLLTKITSLTQHYLTSPTPTLRKQLLDLLSKVSAALAADENAFLPLVNDVWPVIVSRLHDPEPYVVVSACATLAALCEGAGDFLSSRVKTEWWDGLGKWFFRARDDARKISSRGVGAGGLGATRSSRGSMPGKQHDTATGGGIVIPMREGSGDTDGLQLEASSSSSRSGATTSTTVGLGRFASAAQTWDAVVSLLIAIVSFVLIEDDIFEQILDLLADDVLSRNKEARRALEVVNADAVWLAMYERGLVEPLPTTPVMDGVVFAPLGEVGG
ncbi:hypothetical protein VPNG_05913 [Cytospora leucostoma]|uniref:TEL2-interacting protein 1 n=1 Tax=Cytospora leucostoma TaxID=1230097 RepID=A0A423XB43_9PEZI|nr:hypothetical protein VPNG_05913 [Cytospora leucostoma]